MSPLNDLTADFVRSVLTYDKYNGTLFWRKHPVAKYNRYANKIAGSIDKDGYLRVEFKQNGSRKRYPAHRLIWLIMTGVWPSIDIDHINGIRTDNRWDNLRLATRQQNLQNMKIRPNNTSGFKGVSWSKVANKWKAQIRDGNTNKYLGIFSTREEAYTVWCKAALALHREFARFD